MQSLEMKDNVCNGCVWTLWAKFHVLRKKLFVPENARQRIKEIINPFHHIWYLSKSKETECEPDVVKGSWLLAPDRSVAICWRVIAVENPERRVLGIHPTTLGALPTMAMLVGHRASHVDVRILLDHV